jgi:hypothetical protein
MIQSYNPLISYHIQGTLKKEVISYLNSTDQLCSRCILVWDFHQSVIKLDETFYFFSVTLRPFVGPFIFIYFACEAIGTAATPDLLCQPQVIMKMIVEKQMKCRLAGETEVLGENLPQCHFCPSQNPI